MTAAALLALICSAILLQVVTGVIIALWRWRAARAAGRSQPLAMAAATGAWSGLRKFRVVRREFADADQTQCSFYLEPVDGAQLPSFRAGQFLTLTLAIPDHRAASTVTRCYSLSDCPNPRRYRLTVKRLLAPAGMPEMPPGLASNHLHDRVHEGDTLQARAPAGNFFIDSDAATHAVFIAGGIGVTPIMSMLRYVLAEQPLRPVHLYYGVRHGGEQAFRQALATLAREHPTFALHVIYSQARPADVLGQDFHHAGRIDVKLLEQTLPPGQHQFYVCGPASMMQSLVPALAAWGVAPANLHYEAFGPASVRLSCGPNPTASAGSAFEVHFRRSGRTLVWDGQDGNLLEFAERNGIMVESGCRAGGCGSCETTVVSGEVAYAHQPDHDLGPARCLLCVGTPASALVLEA